MDEVLDVKNDKIVGHAHACAGLAAKRRGLANPAYKRPALDDNEIIMRLASVGNSST